MEASDFFADGMAARPRVAGTVARGELNTIAEVRDGFPIPVTRALLDRGEQRFNIYCTPCHGRLGDGAGMIPSRGYRRPPSFHTETVRARPTGHYFDVMTNGFGSMPSYRTMIPPQDRWAIIAYIRALQLSQNATVADVPPDQREPLTRPSATLSPQAGRGALGQALAESPSPRVRGEGTRRADEGSGGHR